MSTPEGSSSTPLSSPNNEASSEPTVAVDATLDDVEIVDVDDGIEKEREVVPGSGKYSSEAWLHFTQITSGGKVIKAKCKYCKTILKAESRNGTNGMKQHAAKCKKRPVASGSGTSMRQKVLTSNFMNDGKKTLDTYAFDHKFARRQLACMIILHEYPLSMVEHIGFRRYSQSLQPLFKVVSRNTIKKDIFRIYDIEKKKMMQLLENNESRVAVTTDMWTSNQKRGFMVVTTHFIDSTWTLRSFILRFIYVPCPHTAPVLCDALLDTFASWNLDRKLSTVTLDNCTTNDAMIPPILETLNPDSLLCCGSLFHMRCAAHLLNLIVKDGLDEIKGSISLIRESVSYWTATPKREEKFEDAAKQLKISCNRKLSLDCPTRWNSTFIMLRSAIPFKDVFHRLKHLLKETNYKSLPKESDWDLAKKICDKLQIFFDATELFSGTKYPTANLFFPKICEIKIALTQWAVCDDIVVQKMAAQMITKYDKYWLDIHGILGVAAVLDPRYKKTLLEYYFPKIYSIGHQSMIDKITKGYCCDLLNEYQQKLGQSGGDESLCHESSSMVEDSLSDYDKFVESRKKQKVYNVKSEMDHYLEEDVLPRARHGEREPFDILAWWKYNGLKYPTLQAMARDILAIPITTVASESAFSTGGRVISPHRNRLHPKTLESLMCAQSWLLALQEGDNREGFGTMNDEEEEDFELSEISTVTV